MMNTTANLRVATPIRKRKNNSFILILKQARLQEMAANLEKLEELRNSSVKHIEEFERKLDDLERQEAETLREVMCTFIISYFPN